MDPVDCSNNMTINVPGNGNTTELVVNSTDSHINKDASNNNTN